MSSGAKAAIVSVAEVALADDRRAGLARAGPRDGLGAHRLDQQRALLVDGVVRRVRRGARADRRVGVAIRVLDEPPGERAHRAVASDDVGFAARAEAARGPVAAAGHDLVDRIDRHLDGDRADDRAVDRDGRYRPRRRRAERRRIRREIGEHDGVGDVRGHRLGVGVGEVGALQRAVVEVCAEIHSLVRGVDDVAVGVEQQHVLVLEELRHPAEEVVVLRVRGRPCAAVAGVVDGDRRLEVVVRDGVVQLQVALGRRGRREGRGVDVVVADSCELGPERAGEVCLDRRAILGAEFCVLELPEAARERLQRLTDALAAGIQQQGVLDRLEQALHLAGPRIANLAEAVEGGLAQQALPVDVADEPDDDAGARAHDEQHDEQDRADAQPGARVRVRKRDRPLGGRRCLTGGGHGTPGCAAGVLWLLHCSHMAIAATGSGRRRPPI